MSDIKDDEKEVLLDHEYDNIQELDNPLPMWWLLTFFGSIIFAFIYVVHFHLADGLSSDEELQVRLNKIQALSQKAQEKAAKNVNWQELANNEEALQMGKKAYDTHCIACHGAQGGGGIGPNLADSYWIHGDGSMPEINKVIKEGVVEKGMPAWSKVLKPKEMQATSAYVYNMQGTSPEGAKAPQGEKITK